MYINVLVETKVKSNDMTFTYHTDKDDLIGKRVLVPFGNRNIEGFVLNYTNKNNDYEIKDIIKVIDEEKVLTDELLNLGKYMKETYLCPLIYAYQVMLPKELKASYKASKNEKKLKYIKLNSKIKNDNIKSKAMINIINILKENKEVLKCSINNKDALKKLINENIVIEYFKEVYRKVNVDKNSIEIKLTKEQKEVSKKIEDKFNTSNTILLRGVTGSGKTEIYIDIVKKIIKKGKTAIILVPEISLTPQITARFKGVFNEDIAIIHSSLSNGERYDEYRRIRNNDVKVVIGARSAIFAPLNNIGIIIIDEEHSESYKQENNPRYDTYDIAQKRAINHNCPVLLASATPKIESYARGIKGYYELLELEKRVNQKPLPSVEIVDMKDEIKKGNSIFSELLTNKINEKLAKKEQVMILLNRRGYANYLSCISCGFVFKCPNCDITLTYHKTSDMLRCHYCGYAQRKIDICPSCHEKAIRQVGIGTEKLEEEIKIKFKDARVLRMDRDTTSKKESHKSIIKSFNNGDYNILVGTQMIAKGLNFPNVTLVGVINADASLNIPNFRSSERTYELLDQVIGRSGRSQKEGEAILQTFNPTHYSIACAKNHDYKTFFKMEMNIRKKLYYPPYCFISLVKITSKDFNYGINEAKKISEYLIRNLKDTIVLGPSMATILKVNNNYNFQIILKYKKELMLNEVLNKIIKIYEGNSKIKVEIDFNAINL